MMGRQDGDQRQLFYEFSLDEMIPTDHLPMEPANCLHGCWAKASRRISPCGKDIHRPMACSPVANSPTTLNETFMFVRMASSCEPRERFMIAASGTTCHNLKIAALARSSNDARAHRSRRSLATSMRMRASRGGTD